MAIDNLVKTATETIARHDIFGKLLQSAEKQYLLDRGVVRSFSAGQVICRQHEREHSLYIVLMGEVEVSEGEGNDELVLAHLGKGEVFGEISALFRIPRVSFVRAVVPTVVLEIAGDLFEEMFEHNTGMRDAIYQRFGDRLTETALRAVPLFRHLPGESLATLMQQTALVSVMPGSYIVKEGESGDAMYIIVHGAARVSHELTGQVLALAIIGPGDYFGEWSVLTGAPRTATVTALSTTDMIRIECKTLLQFIQDNPGVRDRLDMYARNRQGLGDASVDELSADEHAHLSITNLNSILDKNRPD